LSPHPHSSDHMVPCTQTGRKPMAEVGTRIEGLDTDGKAVIKVDPKQSQYLRTGRYLLQARSSMNL
jgi:hypothetical protein